MEYRNATSFPSLAFESVDGRGNEFYVAVLRVSYEVQNDGSLALAKEPLPLLMTDQWYGEINKSSVRQESDLAPFKPWCDVVIIGTAQSPGGKPVERFEAGIRITKKDQTIVNKRMTITGPREWKKRLIGGWRLTSPSPISALPLRYEYAYGGECRIEIDDPAAKRVKKKYRLSEEARQNHPEGPSKAPIAHTCSLANNIGLGFVEPWYAKAKKIRHVPAPQIESPLDPITRFGKTYIPQGVGVMGRAWSSRTTLCGTMDQAFFQSGRPLPDDFDYAYWNGAHPDLQVPWLTGGETVDLINIPLAGRRETRTDSQGNGVTRLVLPETHFCGVTTLADGQLGRYDLNLDTLVFDMEMHTVSATYRLKLPIDRTMQSLEVEQLTTSENEILIEHVQAVNEKIRLYQEAAK